MADAQVLGTCEETHGGSSPLPGTTKLKQDILNFDTLIGMTVAKRLSVAILSIAISIIIVFSITLLSPSNHYTQGIDIQYGWMLYEKADTTSGMFRTATQCIPFLGTNSKGLPFQIYQYIAASKCIPADTYINPLAILINTAFFATILYILTNSLLLTKMKHF